MNTTNLNEDQCNKLTKAFLLMDEVMNGLDVSNDEWQKLYLIGGDLFDLDRNARKALEA